MFRRSEPPLDLIRKRGPTVRATRVVQSLLFDQVFVAADPVGAWCEQAAESAVAAGAGSRNGGTLARSSRPRVAAFEDTVERLAFLGCVAHSGPGERFSPNR